MSIINSIGFVTSKNRYRNVRLLNSKESSKAGFVTTIITGKNGSNKSMLLKEIVASVFEINYSSNWTQSPGMPEKFNILCLSGSIADRFPSKHAGVRPSIFAVPNYFYVGQRINSNMFSRKEPLEVILDFAMDPAKSHRFQWPFFEQAHRFANVKPRVECIFAPKIRSASARFADTMTTTLGKLENIKPDVRARNEINVSYRMAQWMLKEFPPTSFGELDDLIKPNQNRRRFRVTLGKDGPSCPDVSINTLRLGLLTEQIYLQDVNLFGRDTDEELSIFDLSSGEFHIYTSIMAVGLGLESNSTLLIDEPENSLHPQWQRDLMSAIFDICSTVLKKGQMIVSTHSPLIVGASPEGTTVVDLTNEEPEVSTVSYGASSDELLFGQFGVGSSRNRVVVEKIQNAIWLVERGQIDSKDFKALIPDLRNIVRALSPSDPLIEVVNALIEGAN